MPPATSYIDPVIASRIKAAWQALPYMQRMRIAKLLVKTKYQTSPGRGIAEPLKALTALSLSNSKFDVLVEMHRRSFVLNVDASGHITGTDKYEQLDPGWAESIAEWLEHLIIGRHPFNTSPQVIPIPDTVRIAMTGDWGTGNWRNTDNPAPSAKVATQMNALKPDLTIHLGDVYYAGTKDQETHLLAKLWPAANLGALTLNSNHEMYSGAFAYFDQALTDPKFALQKGCSFFALENKNWVIVGLDSAYFSDEEGLYMDGEINDADQTAFLKAQAAKGKNLILLTHHNGNSEDGSAGTLLGLQVTAIAVPQYWFWGHSHMGVVYKASFGPFCRCAGHGGVPWGQASVLESPDVEWYEKRSADDPEVPQRVLNGFAVLDLNGPNIAERFVDENGGTAWSSAPYIGPQH